MRHFPAMAALIAALLAASRTATADIELLSASVGQEPVRGYVAGTPSDADRARYRRDNGFAAKLCIGAVDRLFSILGARGLTSDHPVQRAWRDAHAIQHHIALTWDLQAIIYGTVALGRPCPDQRI